VCPALGSGKERERERERARERESARARASERASERENGGGGGGVERGGGVVKWYRSRCSLVRHNQSVGKHAPQVNEWSWGVGENHDLRLPKLANGIDWSFALSKISQKRTMTRAHDRAHD
jgi:hypothetical protein